MPALRRKSVIKRSVLEALAETRLKEASVLRGAGHYSAAIYFAGYSVECWLKVAACRALDWNDLQATFKTHDLDLLLLHSGLERKMQQAQPVYDNFVRIRGMWPLDRGSEIRYLDPATYGKNDTDGFFDWVGGSDGVTPWLKKQI